MNLTEFLNKNENSRKIFGKRELKIIEKQLNGINLTQSEKNRLSRDIRKKFDFIKEVSRFSEEFELKKGSENWKKIEEAKKIILNSQFASKIKRIILFGSVVKNEMTFRSDIDIAVEFKEEMNLREATKFRIWVSGRVSDKIDIQVYNVLPEKLKKSIKENSKAIYEK